MFKKITALFFIGLLSIAPLTHAQFGGKALNILERPTVESVGNGEVTLSWTEIQSTVTEGESVPSYKIFYSDQPFTGTENTYLEVFGATQGTVKDLQNGVPYNFTVVAVDTNGSESPDFSPSVTATPEGPMEAENGEVLRSAGTVALVRADVSSATEIRMIFNSNIVLPAQNPGLAFTVHEKGNPNAMVEVTNATVDALNKRMVILTTAPMQTNMTYLVIAGVNVANEDGDSVKSGVIDRAEFTVSIPEAPVTNPITGEEETLVLEETDPEATPEETSEESNTIDQTEEVTSPMLVLLDVRNLTATVRTVADQLHALLQWRLPANADGATEQRVYQSTDGTLFSRITSLDPSATSYEAKNLVEGTQYWFKVTRANGQGQESEGVLSKVVALPASGPGLLIFLGSALGTVTILRRKQF